MAQRWAFFLCGRLTACATLPLAHHSLRPWRDNVFGERLWRTIKYEEVYLRAYDSVSAAREGLGRYLTISNTRRPYSSLDGQTPDQACLNTLRPIPVAA